MGVLAAIFASKSSVGQFCVTGSHLLLAFSIWLAIPYAIYYRQVTGKPPGILGIIIYLVFTGLLLGIPLVLFWDLVRFVISLVPNTPPIKYAINTSGLLRR